MGEETNVWVLLNDDSVIYHADANLAITHHDIGVSSLTIYPSGNAYGKTIAFYPEGRYTGVTSVEAIAEQWGWQRPDPKMDHPVEWTRRDKTYPVLQLLVPAPTPNQVQMMIDAARQNNLPMHLSPDQLSHLITTLTTPGIESVVSYPLLSALVLDHGGVAPVHLSAETIKFAEQYAVQAKQHGNGSVSLSLVEVPASPPVVAGQSAEGQFVQGLKPVEDQVDMDAFIKATREMRVDQSADDERAKAQTVARSALRDAMRAYRDDPTEQNREVRDAARQYASDIGVAGDALMEDARTVQSELRQVPADAPNDYYGTDSEGRPID